MPLIYYLFILNLYQTHTWSPGYYDTMRRDEYATREGGGRGGANERACVRACVRTELTVYHGLGYCTSYEGFG